MSFRRSARSSLLRGLARGGVKRRVMPGVAVQSPVNLMSSTFDPVHGSRAGSRSSPTEGCPRVDEAVHRHHHRPDQHRRPLRLPSSSELLAETPCEAVRIRRWPQPGVSGYSQSRSDPVVVALVDDLSTRRHVEVFGLGPGHDRRDCLSHPSRPAKQHLVTPAAWASRVRSLFGTLLDLRASPSPVVTRRHGTELVYSLN